MPQSRLSAFAILALVASWLLAMPAHAGLRKCDSRTTTHTDYGALKRAATRSAARHVLDWKTASLCMNPGYGFAWVSARPEPQPDGTRVDIAAICDRDRGPWKCEVQSRRTYEFSTPISGREQKFALEIPLEMGVEEARAFAALAFEKGATITVLHACERPADEKRTAQDDEYDRDLHVKFSARDEPVQGAIQATERGMSFSNDSYSLEFTRASPADPWTFECWFQVIVVA